MSNETFEEGAMDMRLVVVIDNEVISWIHQTENAAARVFCLSHHTKCLSGADAPFGKLDRVSTTFDIIPLT
jgi:hypothetical protein